ncbi:MAG: hypothetical protein JXA82_14115 [Sedimentisphaerales bacterium]|nr:hypothetical protein [Sedimentisphaerales bacterium]
MITLIFLITRRKTKIIMKLFDNLDNLHFCSEYQGYQVIMVFSPTGMPCQRARHEKERISEVTID